MIAAPDSPPSRYSVTRKVRPSTVQLPCTCSRSHKWALQAPGLKGASAAKRVLSSQCVGWLVAAWCRPQLLMSCKSCREPVTLACMSHSWCSNAQGSAHQVLQDLGMPTGAENGHLLHKGLCSTLVLLALQHLQQACAFSVLNAEPLLALPMSPVNG